MSWPPPNPPVFRAVTVGDGDLPTEPKLSPLERFRRMCPDRFWSHAARAAVLFVAVLVVALVCAGGLMEVASRL